MQHMRQLKNILQSKIFYFIILIISILYTIYSLDNINFINKDENVLIGKITNIVLKDNKISFEIKNKEKVLVNYYFDNEDDIGYFNNLKLGDEVKITGNYKEINNNTIFNLFNYKNYLLSKNIKYMFEFENKEDLEKKKSSDKLLYKIKNSLINYIETFKSETYLKTFILGQNGIDDVYKESYQTNGISHLFAISGMHITLFTLILEKILKSIFKNKKYVYFIIYIFLFIFMFLASFTPSIIRGSLLYILNSLNKLLKLNIKTICLLIFIFSCLLLINPFYIYNVGFQFSFVVSFYLIICSEIINRSKNYFLKVFMTSLIAFIVTIPININNYFEINLLTPFINIIFVPFISIIVFPFSLTTLLFPFLDEILLFLTDSIEFISFYVSKIDCFIVILRHMDILGIVIYYLVINYVLFCFYKNNFYQIIYLLILIFIHTNYNYFDNYNVVTTLDVGQGDSLLIKLPRNNGNILIDTGGIISYGNQINDYSIAISKTIPYLKSLGLKEINYLILSHGDYDHMGEAINLVNNFKVEKVIFNCGPYNDLEKELIKVLNKKKIPYYSCIKELNVSDNKLYFLNNKDYGNENDNSNVIYTELNNYKFLFMGDVGVEVEEDLIDKYNLQDIDVLKVGHHGSKTSSGKPFIDEINPKYGVISVGKNNRYGHPNKEVLENLDNSKIYRTDQGGSIMFKIKNNKLKIETCSP